MNSISIVSFVAIAFPFLICLRDCGMGRILFYVTSGCPHCVRAKQLLDKKNIFYETINLDDNPERRQEMIMASSGRKTVPQIFFNYDHIGVNQSAGN